MSGWCIKVMDWKARYFNVWFVILVCALVLGMQYFPQANKFDLIEQFLPMMVLVFVIVVGCVKGWFFSYWKRRRSSEANFKGIPTGIFVLLMGFVLWSTLAFVFGDVKTFGFTEIYMLWAGALLFMYFATLKSSQDRVSALEKWLPIGLALLLVANVFLGIEPFLQSDHSRFFGLFYNAEIKADAWPNAFALFFLLTFPSFVKFLFRKGNGLRFFVQQIVYLAVLGVVLAGFVLTASRAGMLALIVQFALFLLIFRREVFGWIVGADVKMWLFRVLAVGLIFLFGSHAYVGMSFSKSMQLWQKPDIGGRMLFEDAQGMNSFTERLEFFNGSVELIGKEPLFGYGPSSFKWVYPQVQDGFLALSDHPHNLILKFGVERGVPSALFFLGLLFVLFVKANPLKRDTSTFAKLLWVTVLGAMAHSMVDHNFNFATNYLILWLALAGLASQIPQSPSKKMTNSDKVQLATAIVLVLILAYASICITRQSLYYHRLNFVDPSRNSAALGDIENYDPLLPRWTYLRLDDAYAKRLAAIESGDMNGDLNEAWEDRKILLEKHLAANPYDMEVYMRLAEVSLQQEDSETALKYYSEAIERNPKNTFRHYSAYVETAASLNRADLIEQIKPQILDLIEEYTPLYEQNLHYTQRDGEMEYVKSLEQSLAGF